MEDRHIPYYVYEGTMARFERTIKRLGWLLVIALLFFFLSNIAWLYVWNQYDYSSYEDNVTIDGGRGIANYIGNNGDIDNGTNYSYTESPYED